MKLFAGTASLLALSCLAGTALCDTVVLTDGRVFDEIEISQDWRKAIAAAVGRHDSLLAIKGMSQHPKFMRLFRDTLVFCRSQFPAMNVNSIGGYHIREAGATRVQDLAFSMVNGIAYLQEGVDAGLEVDDFAARFTFNLFGGSMQVYHEIAFQRAARRMWARILKERFGATNPKAMIIRPISPPREPRSHRRVRGRSIKEV